ncbi:cell division protein ZapA [Yoonia maritima]|uniref:cell division protein ZapA n=1 Tax=Yoonia maritima TaxID=1435347 RepID=UPI000D0EB6AB|nr:cell division protein ZapA [Yoonia maritima]
MPQVEISIGGRSFEVACQVGEEQFLQSAAALLDSEASHLADQMGRMPEARMLLMAGLMLADKAVGMDSKLIKAQTEVEALRSELKTLRSQPAPVPERVEVPVVPAAVKDALAEIAARAEALADQVDGQG